MDDLKVSIIVPVYKVERYLRECIDSILSQTFKGFELILVDDCSPDNCPAICDEYAKQDPRVVVIHHKTNLGSVSAYRDGVNTSKGEYISFVDSDDWIEKETMERLYNRAIAEGCDIVYNDVIRFITENNKLISDKPFDTRGMEKKDIVINMIEDKFVQYMPSKLFRRNLFDGIVWPDFMFREDTVICIQLFLNAKTVGYEYSVLYHYRFTLNSITTSNKKRYRLIREVYENYKKLDDILKSRSDYDLYKTTMIKILNRYKQNDRFMAYYYIKRFFMAFVPYGFIIAYRRSKEKSQNEE